jgi:hypothetical protein
VQLERVITASVPKLPLDVSIRGEIFFSNFDKIIKHFSLAHWLAIDGKQPATNENPEIISKNDIIADSLDSVSAFNCAILILLIYIYR